MESVETYEIYFPKKYLCITISSKKLVLGSYSMSQESSNIFWAARLKYFSKCVWAVTLQDSSNCFFAVKLQDSSKYVLGS